MNERMLDFVEIDKIATEPLLFQTGYLTIKDIPKKADIPVYHLTIPNFEVREAFSIHVLTALTENAEMSAWRMHQGKLEALNYV